MSKIPLPQRGQPIDLTYLYDVANAVNELSSQISPSSYKYVSVDTPSNGTQSVKASEAKIIAGYVEVANNSTVSNSNDKEFYFNITGNQFKYPPIVTATPIMIGTTDSGKNTTIILKNVTTSRIDGIVQFNKTGDVKVGVNLLMIGIPN
jgi:hypothetical protein